MKVRGGNGLATVTRIPGGLYRVVSPRQMPNWPHCLLALRKITSNSFIDRGVMCLEKSKRELEEMGLGELIRYAVASGCKLEVMNDHVTKQDVIDAIRAHHNRAR